MALLNSDTTESHLGPSTLKTFFDHEGEGGQTGMFFLDWLFSGQHLANSGGVQIKNNPVYEFIF